MGFLRDIANFLWRAVTALSSSVVMVGTLIVSAITGFCSFIYSVVNGAFGILPYFFTILEKFETAIDSLRSVLTETPYWHFFYNCFALDVFAEGLSYFLTLFGLVLFLSLFGFFFAALSAITPFLIIRLLRTGVSVCSGGFLKP